MKKLCAAAILCFHSLVLFSQTRAQTEATRSWFPGNIDPSAINIVRDVYGVPHIFAETDAEVAYGLAWAHSEDDFETIQKTLLASRSMLGLYFGRDGAIVDYAVHLLGIRELVNARYEDDLSADFKAVLQGYCDGFNAYAYTHPKEVLVKKAFPATPQDLVAYSVLQLALGCGVEKELKKIFHGTIPLTEWEPQGSNAFAFNSKKTTDGNTYLAINTHHPLEGQVAWYEAHLHSEEGWNIIGTLFPGSPVIFTGVNENLGWTHTVNHPDRLDVYQLEVNPENMFQYKVDNMWYTLEESTVKLKVKVPGFNLHVKRKIYNSIYGPTVMTDRGVFSIRTTALMDIRGLEQWYRMNKARTFTQFKNALKMEALPSYNVMYADRFDTIYYISNARIPFRNEGYDWRGTLPGNTTKTLWNQIHPIEDMPQVLNPASGFLYNTNHSPFNATVSYDNIHREKYDPSMGFETHDNNRSLRVMELLQGMDKVGYEDFKRIKYDLQLPKKLAYPVNLDTLFLLDKKQHPELAEVIDVLRTWDRKGTIDSKGATVFAICFYYVADLYKKDETLKSLSEPQCAEVLAFAKNHLLKYFGTVHVRLGEYQRLERGDWSMPLPGLPDVLAAMYSTPTENGRVKGSIGECYVGLIRFTSAGPEIETVNCYGASNRRNSPHYDDQMRLFQNQQTKKMTLNKALVYGNARNIYQPEILSKLLSARLTRARR